MLGVGKVRVSRSKEEKVIVRVKEKVRGVSKRKGKKRII